MLRRSREEVEMLLALSHCPSPSLPSLSSLSVTSAATPPSSTILITNSSCSISNHSLPSRRLRVCRAAALESVTGKEEEEQVLLLAPEEAKVEQEEKYDWREEWYPLYLSDQVPEDAPLGLTVYHKQLVLYRDGQGVLRCYQDRCPHRLAKLSEGQLIDGRLECLYHGWQFQGDGQCVRIPQLPEGAKIPRTACLKPYQVRDSQGVVWVWMSETNPLNDDKLPWFEHYARPGFQDLSTIHELPYDHSILLENLMDPAHVPISHDRTDWTAKREDAQALIMTVTERTGRGFAGEWGRTKNAKFMNKLRFQAPCVLQNNLEFVDEKGVENYYSALFLCRPAGQGKSMLIVRFGASKRSFVANMLPKWFFHQNAAKVFEQDMGFLSSQNEVLMKEKVPTKELYLNLKSCDTWVAEYRKWMDRAGPGMPYFVGHSTVSLPQEPAVLEQAPAGLAAGMSASFPAKGGIGTKHAPNPVNRYFRHVVHCKGCRSVVRSFGWWKNALLFLALVAAASAILASTRQWKALFLTAAAVLGAGSYACTSAVSLITTNFVRTHRRL